MPEGRTLRRLSRSEKWVPFVYIGIAVVLAAVLLPSAFRPPRDQPTTSGGFSPDSPQNKNQAAAALYSSFGSASSGTAGGTVAGPNGPNGAPPTTTTTQPPVKLVASACPYGYGNPPRQIESIYAPPCAPAFTGNNGGATSKGVTGDSINECFVMSLTGAGSDGPIPTTPQPGESAVTRTYRVFQAYFNSRYQFYGRTLHFYYVGAPSGETGAQAERDRAVKADEQDHCFSAFQETDPNSIDELTRRKIFTFTLAQLQEPYFAYRDPYLWSFTPEGNEMVTMGTEYACKRLAGKPPSYTNDPTFDQTKPRTWGIIAYNPPEYDDIGAEAAKALKDTCGIDAVVEHYDLSGSAEGTAGLSAAMTDLRAHNVTTVFYLGDLISAVAFTQAADSNHYFPEWFVPAFGGVDTGHIARDYSMDQWAHAFGFSFYEIPRPDEETECYKAYHAIDPNNDPDSGMCTYMWDWMVQQFAAIQQAGPDLNIENVKKAMLAMPQLSPNPPWHMAGYYSPTTHTYPKWASEIWWDNNAIGSDGQKGTYRFDDNGQRYTFGGWPTTPPKVFQDTASAIALAPDSQTSQAP